MSKKKFILSFVWSFLFLMFVTTVLCSTDVAEATSTITVGLSGSGANYICDPSNAQIGMNQAMKEAKKLGKAIVVLKGPATYTVRNTVTMYSNTSLTAEPGVKLRLGNNIRGWAEFQGMIEATNQKNISVYGFEIDGNFAGNPRYKYGKGYFNMMWFKNCQNIEVYNMYLHDSHGDGVRVNGGIDVSFHHNKVDTLGHDALFCLKVAKVKFFSNTVVARANSACRTNNSNHVLIYDNYITAHKLYCGPGIQIESNGVNKMNDIQVFNNTIERTYGPGIWLIRADSVSGSTVNYRDSSYATNVRIFNNIFKGCGRHPTITRTGGIVINGWNNTVIQNNRFDGNLGTAVMYSNGYSVETRTLIENNQFIGTLPHGPSGNGYGIWNRNSNHDFINGGGNIFINNRKNVVGPDMIKGAAHVLEELRNIGSDIDWSDLANFSGVGSSLGGFGGFGGGGRTDPLRKPQPTLILKSMDKELAEWAEETKKLLEKGQNITFVKPNIKRIPDFIDAIFYMQDPNYKYDTEFPDFPRIYDKSNISGITYQSPYDTLMQTFDHLGEQAGIKGSSVQKEQKKPPYVVHNAKTDNSSSKQPETSVNPISDPLDAVYYPDGDDSKINAYRSPYDILAKTLYDQATQPEKTNEENQEEKK
jgi:hypothetical protein